jgi:hypothetical protein
MNSMCSAIALLGTLLLVSSLVAGCSCLAADSYGSSACQKYRTHWGFDPGWDD